MKKICASCGKEIKGKPVIYDDYYFCNENQEDRPTCLAIWLL